jgi:hypothetical protein
MTPADPMEDPFFSFDDETLLDIHKGLSVLLAEPEIEESVKEKFLKGTTFRGYTNHTYRTAVYSKDSTYAISYIINFFRTAARYCFNNEEYQRNLFPFFIDWTLVDSEVGGIFSAVYRFMYYISTERVIPVSILGIVRNANDICVTDLFGTICEFACVYFLSTRLLAFPFHPALDKLKGQSNIPIVFDDGEDVRVIVQSNFPLDPGRFLFSVEGF